MLTATVANFHLTLGYLRTRIGNARRLRQRLADGSGRAFGPVAPGGSVPLPAGVVGGVLGGGGGTIPPPLIVPWATSVSARPLLSVSATCSALPAGGSVNELCVSQQLMSLLFLSVVSSVKPSDVPTDVSVNGALTGTPPTGSGTNL